MENQIPNLDGWDDFLGKYLKADHIKVWPAVVVFTGVSGSFDEEENAHIIYDIEYNGKKRKWEPNKTNIDIMRKVGAASPKALVGKKVTFIKIRVRNPMMKVMVDSLLIDKIE